MHSAYAPNIISRIDRRTHLQNAFKKWSEFTLHIIPLLLKTIPASAFGLPSNKSSEKK